MYKINDCDVNCGPTHTQEVTRAGNAKREELLRYLKTSDGEALVAKVAILLVHARREEVRAVRRREAK